MSRRRLLAALHLAFGRRRRWPDGVGFVASSLADSAARGERLSAAQPGGERDAAEPQQVVEVSLHDGTSDPQAQRLVVMHSDVPETDDPPAPARVVDGGLYGPKFIAKTVTNKVLDILPLHRQSDIWAREGLAIARSTLGELFHRAASLMEPLYVRMLALIATAHVVYADETSLKMQRVKKLGYVWTFATEEHIVYVFSKDRSGIALGRKNYLFVGHEDAGRNLAMLASLLQSCVLHEIDPQRYIADVLLRVQDHPIHASKSCCPRTGSRPASSARWGPSDGYIALGRKNYLFVGHEDAGGNLAILASLLQSCVLHEIEPQSYVADVLLRVQDHPASRIDELLPANWRPRA